MLIALLLLSALPAVADAAEFGERGRPWWIAHGIFMILAFALLIPFGALVAVYRRYVGTRIFQTSGSFFSPHRTIQIIGLISMFLGLIMAAVGSEKEYGISSPFNPILWDYTSVDIPGNRHVKIGVSVIIMASIQLIFGYWSHFLKSDHDMKVANGEGGEWKRPYVPTWLHIILGLATLVLGYTNLYQGLQLYDLIFDSSSVSGGVAFGYVCVTLSVFVFTGAYLYEKCSIYRGSK